MMNSVTRSVIVTGASGGIGGSVATRLAKDSFAVVVNYAGNAAPAQSVVEEIEAAGGQAATSMVLPESAVTYAIDDPQHAIRVSTSKAYEFFRHRRANKYFRSTRALAYLFAEVLHLSRIPKRARCLQTESVRRDGSGFLRDQLERSERAYAFAPKRIVDIRPSCGFRNFQFGPTMQQGGPNDHIYAQQAEHRLLPGSGRMALALTR